MVNKQDQKELALRDILRLDISKDAQQTLLKSLPAVIKDLARDEGGNVIMNVNISGSYNNNSGNLNSFGNDVNQQQTMDNEFTDAYKMLIESIAKLSEDQKDQAIYLAEQIKLAYQEKDSEKAKKPLKFLTDLMGCIGAIASLAKILGLPI